MRQIAIFGVLWILLGTTFLSAGNAGDAFPSPLILGQTETAPPEAQPPTTPERLENDLPEEAVLHEENRLLYQVLAFLIVVAVLATLIWAFRSGRQNKPVTGGKGGRPGSD